MFDASGTLIILTDEELSRFITTKGFGNIDQERGRQGMVSMKPHPSFIVPWYHLHPCGMHELVKELDTLENRRSVVCLFLSVLQLILGINLIQIM